MLPRPDQQRLAWMLLLNVLSSYLLSPAGPEDPDASLTTPWGTAAATCSGAAGITTAAAGMWAAVMTGGPATGTSGVTTTAAVAHTVGNTPGGTSASGMMRCAALVSFSLNLGSHFSCC